MHDGIGAKYLLSLSLALVFSAAIHSQEVHRTNLRDFRLPVYIEAGRQDEVKQLVLYISTNRGISWERYATSSPKGGHFDVNVPGDGEYWFLLQIVDQSGKANPAEVTDHPPTMKVLVEADAKAQRQRAARPASQVEKKTTKPAPAATSRQELHAVQAQLRGLQTELNDLSVNEIRARLQEIRQKLRSASRKMNR